MSRERLVEKLIKIPSYEPAVFGVYQVDHNLVVSSMFQLIFWVYDPASEVPKQLQEDIERKTEQVIEDIYKSGHKAAALAFAKQYDSIMEQLNLPQYKGLLPPPNDSIDGKIIA